MSSIVASITGQQTGNHGGAGLGYDASGTPIQSPVTNQQAGNAWAQSQAGLGNQQAFLQAIQAQNGLGNQSQVFNQLQGVANGTGPNPALAQLNQTTAANTANQASLMADQRGSSANVGLIARQAAQQGGANQQNAAGQAATLQANQSLNALNSMGSLATNQANQQSNATNAYSQSAQGEQANLLNSISGVNSANVGMQSNINSSNAGISAVAAKGQQDLIGNIFGGAGSAAGLVPKAEGGLVEDAKKIAPMAMMFMADGGTATTPLQSSTPGPQSRVGKFFAGSSDAQPSNTAAPLTGMAQAGSTIGKGIVTGIGNLFSSSSPAKQEPKISDEQLAANNELSQMGGNEYIKPDAAAPDMSVFQNQDQSEVGSLLGNYFKGGKVPALVSPGETYLTPSKAKEVAKKGKNPLAIGERIPGKPKVKGNSYANDTVPKTLEAGGIVIPNSIMQSKDAEKRAAAFVRAHLAKSGSKRGLK